MQTADNSKEPEKKVKKQWKWNEDQLTTSVTPYFFWFNTDILGAVTVKSCQMTSKWIYYYFNYKTPIKTEMRSFLSYI